GHHAKQYSQAELQQEVQRHDAESAPEAGMFFHAVCDGGGVGNGRGIFRGRIQAPRSNRQAARTLAARRIGNGERLLRRAVGAFVTQAPTKRPPSALRAASPASGGSEAFPSPARSAGEGAEGGWGRSSQRSKTSALNRPDFLEHAAEIEPQHFGDTRAIFRSGN